MSCTGDPFGRPTRAHWEAYAWQAGGPRYNLPLHLHLKVLKGKGRGKLPLIRASSSLHSLGDRCLCSWEGWRRGLFGFTPLFLSLDVGLRSKPASASHGKSLRRVCAESPPPKDLAHIVR